MGDLANDAAAKSGSGSPRQGNGDHGSDAAHLATNSASERQACAGRRPTKSRLVQHRQVPDRAGNRPLSEAELSAYCRCKGIYPEQVAQWRLACEQAN